MKRKVIVETLSLLANLSGVGRYTYENVKLLTKNKDYKWKFFYGYVSEKIITPSEGSSKKKLRNLIVSNPLFKQLIRNTLFSLARLIPFKYDLYWQPNFIPNKGIRAHKIITTVHDFSWEIYPEFQPKERVEFFEKFFYHEIKRCNHIITGSNFTKAEILQRLDFEPENISVIYHGVNHKVFNTLLPKKNVEQKYILAVGSIEPRKNLKNLLLAYEQLSETIKNQYHLILIGAQGWNNTEVLDMMESMKEWVHYTGYVSDEELACYYQHASLFVYPSFYEGFGIPPLEAMACGTAVLVSNASTLPEICSDAAVYCDPNDVNDIKVKIELVLNNMVLRQKLVTKGLERVKIFSWDKSAKEHLEVFEKVLNS
ncbi:MAG: glycosyltransferase family 1 protein [Erysipelotrichia bacterium]|nr:glycosyltransferase family 1 protein [Erysipelotrichia bacterium]